MRENLGALQTEARNPRTNDIDTASTLDACRLMNEEDLTVAQAVQEVLPDIARGVDAIAEAFRREGRLLYFGAGTSGRIGLLDASESLPTFSATPGMVQGYIAGGPSALTEPVEGAEDSREQGAGAVDAAGVTERDVVVGITASGRTPYVLGALDRARELGAVTIGIGNCSPAAISSHCDIAILAVTGPEVVQGSTRLKAATAQKMVVNMLSTIAMVRIGKTYGNLMIDVLPTSAKLRDRARRILVTCTGCSPEEAAVALRESGNHVKVAAVMLLAHCDAETAARRLEEADGFVARAAA